MGMSQTEDWVLPVYRLPRVPSTPRSAVWRKLKRLGVGWLGGGLVALPSGRAPASNVTAICSTAGTSTPADSSSQAARPLSKRSRPPRRTGWATCDTA